MKSPIVISERGVMRGPDLRVFTFYLRRPWRRLAEVTILRTWHSIVNGYVSGIEITFANGVHIALTRRSA